MKPQELFEATKITELKKYGDSVVWENKLEQKFFKKNGYYWRIYCHSQDEGVLMNNYERDCVIAYVKNNFLTLFIIKIRGGYRGFVYLNESIQRILGTYRINRIWDKQKALKIFEENEKEFSRMKKMMLLENLENGSCL
jgi:hypothetical protein